MRPSLFRWAIRPYVLLLVVAVCVPALMIGVAGCGSEGESSTTEMPTTSSTESVDTTLPESTTSTVEETTTTETSTSPPVTTEPLSNAETLLANGRVKVAGYIDKVWESGGRRYISIDYIRMLTGEEANQAAVKDGFIEPGEDVPNDYYIVNENPKKREFVVSASADIKMWTYSEETKMMADIPITWAQFKTFWTDTAWDGSVYRTDVPWWIEREGDEVLSLHEQYLP